VGKVRTNSGILLNKRLITALNLSFNHTLDPAPPGHAGAGWVLAAEEDGQIKIRFTDGTTESIRVKRGDQLVSLGDDLYLVCQPGKDGTGQSKAHPRNE
jgi:hypothetical protein